MHFVVILAPLSEALVPPSKDFWHHPYMPTEAKGVPLFSICPSWIALFETGHLVLVSNVPYADSSSGRNNLVFWVCSFLKHQYCFRFTLLPHKSVENRRQILNYLLQSPPNVDAGLVSQSHIVQIVWFSKLVLHKYPWRKMTSEKNCVILIQSNWKIYHAGAFS